MNKYVNTYIVSVCGAQDPDILDIDEREELEDIIDEEITEAHDQIENWCNEYNCNYEMIDTYRCNIVTNDLYASEELPSTLKAIETNLLKETYIIIENLES